MNDKDKLLVCYIFFNFNFHPLSKRGFAMFVWVMSILIKTTNSVYKPLTCSWETSDDNDCSLWMQSAKSKELI